MIKSNHQCIKKKGGKIPLCKNVPPFFCQNRNHQLGNGGEKLFLHLDGELSVRLFPPLSLCLITQQMAQNFPTLLKAACSSLAFPEKERRTKQNVFLFTRAEERERKRKKKLQ